MSMEGTSQSQDVYQQIIVLIGDVTYAIDDVLQKGMQA
tara:strand:+ start:368 stop:481 length:114 start_codon:yes stop_codon:yes gene_type:complete